MATYLDSPAYWALVKDTEPRLRPVEVGELTAYLNGTSTKLRESLRFAVKVIEAEIDGLRVAEEKKAEAEEARLARKREYERKRRGARIVQGVVATGCHAQPQEIEGEKENLPPTPPIKEKGEDKESPPATPPPQGGLSLCGVYLDSKHNAGVGGGAREGCDGGPAPHTPPEQADHVAGAGNAPKRFVPPTVEEVAAYVREKGYTFDPESFVAFYASKGWKVGDQPMKDWRMACITWQKRRNEKGGDAPADAEAEARREALRNAPLPKYEMH